MLATKHNDLIAPIKNKNGYLQVSYTAVLQGWVHALALRDTETRDHTHRVVKMALCLARLSGIPSDEMEQYRWGALLHDVGKILIPDAIIQKNGPLTPEEKNIIMNHPRYAYEILSPIALPGPVVDIPHFHHEKWDGTGYPLGLRGREIPLSARIFAVVDVWDALNSKRPYRDAWEYSAALDYIHAESGRHFDPDVSAAFLGMISAPGSVIN